MSADDLPVVVLGAGPAGLGAAWQLARRGRFDVMVLERQSVVGGNAGSFEIDGMRVDYGSHRLHPACSPEILSDIRRMLGSTLLDRPRHGRIRLLGRWLHFPLKPLDLARRVPPSFLAGVTLDALVRKTGSASGDSFASVLERYLGATICRDFYFPYASKIWGVPPTELDAEQARRRVSTRSLGKMIRKVLNAVPGLAPKGTGTFFYPRGGFGAISEAYLEAARAAGAKIQLETTVDRIDRVENRVVSVTATDAGGQRRCPARYIISTIPLTSLVRAISPPAPADVLDAAGRLRYRAMILIYLVLDTDRFTEYDAHYFPGPEIAVTRVSEPKNYGLTGPSGTTVLCAELPCNTSDPVWSLPELALRDLVCDALDRAQLPIRAPIRRVVTRWLSHAYPIYLRGYRAHFDLLDTWIDRLEGVVTLGRQGLFAHDNTHHTLAMAYAAAECLDDGGTFDGSRWRAHRQTFETHVVED